MNVALRIPMTQEEFFLWADARDGRYEFDGVQPFAMSDGTRNHSHIIGNINLQLRLPLCGTGCKPLMSDVGIATIGTRVCDPDALVTCTPSDGDSRLIPNPMVVFEVVSASSARDDRIHTLREHHAVPSIQRYVIVEQTGMGLPVFSREQDEPLRGGTGRWRCARPAGARDLAADRQALRGRNVRALPGRARRLSPR